MTPASIACLKVKTGPPTSRSVVKPRSSVRSASAVDAAKTKPGSAVISTAIGTAAYSVCQWASIMPGIRTRSAQSMTVAPAGGALLVVSTEAMRLPSTRIWTPDRSASDVPSNRRTFVNSVLAASRAAWAKLARAPSVLTAAAVPMQERKDRREKASRRREACCRTGLKQLQPLPWKRCRPLLLGSGMATLPFDDIMGRRTRPDCPRVLRPGQCELSHRAAFRWMPEPDCDDCETVDARDRRRGPGDGCVTGVSGVGYAARSGARAVAHLRAGRHACRRDRQIGLDRLPAARGLDLPRRAPRGGRQDRRGGARARQPLLRRQPDLSGQLQAGLQSLLHSPAQRAAGRRGGAAARPDRFTLQPAPRRALVSRRRLRRRCDPAARARNGAGGADGRRMGGLDGGHAPVGARGATAERFLGSVAHRRLLQRRRAGGEIRPRCARRCEPAAARQADPDLADDRHHQL